MNGGRPHPASEDLSQKLTALTDLDTAALRREWRRLYRSHPPLHIRRDLLVLAIAWKLQEKVYGGLTAAQKRKLSGIAEMRDAMGWQAHSVRGFLAGTVKKMPGVLLVSEKPEGGPRRYRVEAPGA